MADQYIYCEGSMQKKEAKGKWVTYYCVLKGDRLWCFSNRDTNNPNSLVGSIKMSSATQLKKHKTKEGNYQFKIRNDRGEYRFRCSFTSDRDRWLMEISRCARGDIPSSALNQQGSLNQGPTAMGSAQHMQGAAPQPGHTGAQRVSSMPAQGGMHRPQMEVPGMPGMMGGGGGGADNLLPGQRIALEEQRQKRGTSFHGAPRSMGDSPAGLLSQQPPQHQFVRGAGSSASIRSIAPRGGQTRENQLSDSEYANQEWFYGPIPRDVAEDYIMSYGLSGSFLLRESESSPGCYSLSFKSEHNDVRHYKIVRSGNRYTLTGLEERSFPNIIQVVQYYVEVNEGWAQPLRRSDTGYQKHPGLRDDATPGFTSGFDMPTQGAAPSWTPGQPVATNPGSTFPHVGGYVVTPPGPPTMSVVPPMDRGGIPAPGMHPIHVPSPSPPPPAQQWQGGGGGGFHPPPPPPMDPPPPNMDTELEYSDAAHEDFPNLPPPSPTRLSMGFPHQPPPPMDPPPPF